MGIEVNCCFGNFSMLAARKAAYATELRLESNASC